MKRGHDDVEVRILAVDMIDEHRTGKTHVLGLAPQFIGHDLRTRYSVNDEQSHFGSLHSGKRVANEIRVT